ncbi:MAG: hypothetical protein DMF54_01515 [Acidobacteria bacterium]|nr:MAG: hypothetical protein DMF54_01515 [Acidobacteriota bacterium]
MTFRAHATSFPSGEMAVPSNSVTLWSVARTDSIEGRGAAAVGAASAQARVTAQKVFFRRGPPRRT